MSDCILFAKRNDMAKKKEKEMEADFSAEERLKEAAIKVFTQKGYAATRTRDIAKEAGLNLALLNYYFRSKEKLFEIIMMEKLQQLFEIIIPLANDPSTSLDKKLTAIASEYIDMLSVNENLPLFILHEIRSNPERFVSKMQVTKIFSDSVMIKQIRERRSDINPIHFVINILGMVVFPFIAKPILFSSGQVDDKAFGVLINERKKLIPLWVKAILKAK
ncbi:transcriptional regulator, TetR family [Sporocytophaga myxococcoides]|uniref:Transcriptional regulator, TetR family n=1 Tax=Sporocytophaga myxococcoides TaxID=153721 RepID=A0A098L8N4_9BACT|nr:TetR/AcrR family transcriptional regulator [Sporocytophaga myxococcoides]GAL83191.1 transcriptional regulator, TetR family [Sporocytophaga myxococcoides]